MKMHAVRKDVYQFISSHEPLTQFIIRSEMAMFNEHPIDAFDNGFPYKIILIDSFKFGQSV